MKPDQFGVLTVCLLVTTLTSTPVLAQSSVILYGTADLSARFVKNDGSSRRLALAQDGVNSSQLGFRGAEDLGGGLKAGFNLLAGVNADTGTVNAKFWNRQSIVYLSGSFGEIRLGRDYQPTFWVQGTYDAFGFVGLGSTGNVKQLYAGTRMDNSIGYILPGNLGGVYGQGMIAAAEGGGTADRPARYLGARLGYAHGPFDIQVSAAQQRFGASGAVVALNGGGIPTPYAAGDSHRTMNVGASWDFKLIKVSGYFDVEKLEEVREKIVSISAIVPLGQSQIRVGYDRSKRDGAVYSVVDQVKATYQYNLSKRTATYATIARISNKDATNLSIAGGSNITALPRAGGTSQGFEFGVRHFF